MSPFNPQSAVRTLSSAIRRVRVFASRVRALLSRGRRERDLDEEIAHHLAALADDARANGAPDEAARLSALRTFGGVAQTREAWREQRGFARVEAFWLDLRLAMRTLGRRPLLLAAASLSIAVGVGLNIGVYAAVTRVLFGTSISGAAPDERLLAINGEISYPNFQDLSRLDAFSGVAAMQVTRVSWRSDAGMSRIGAKIVSPNFFDVVGIRPAYGRTFRDDDDPHTTVFGFGFWQRRFGGDPSLVGRTMTLNGWPHVVIGIMPIEFNAPVAPMVATDLYLPISPQVSNGLQDRAAPQFDLVARLRDGVTPEQGRAVIATAASDLERQYPRENVRFASAIHVLPVAGLGFWRGMAGGAFPMLLAAATTIYALVGLVMLVACANVAGLLLARAEERRREIAVCAALGATRWRLAQRFIAESAIIALSGCAIAALLYWAAVAAVARFAWTAGALTVMPPPLPIAYCITLVLVVTAACSVGPAWAVSQVAPGPAIRSGSAPGGGRRAGMRHLLVVGQVAICFVLLNGASLLFHDVLRLRAADPGFDTVHTMSVEVRMPVNVAGGRRAPFERLRPVIGALPGVESVSSARNMPLMFLTWRASFHMPSASDVRMQADIMPIGPRYLETMKIPLLRGRDIGDADLRFQGRVTPIVVNETLAHRFFGTADPIGRQLVLERGGGSGPDRTLQIAGIARDSKMRSLDEDPHPVVYLPEVGDFFFVRVAGAVSSALRMVEQAVSTAEPAAWVQAQTLESQVEFARMPARIGGSALAALGAIGLTMAMVGLYAVVSYTVNRRTFEIGVRLALGATRGSVLRLIVREGLVVVAIGSAIGAVAAFLIVRALTPLITLNRGRFDPVALGAVVVAMAIVGAAASLAPARRAARVDPIVALRAE